MKNILIGLIAVLFVAGCDSSKPENIVQCGDYVVEYNLGVDETLTADINGDTVNMNLVISGSGAKYMGELNEVQVVFWNKGSDWTLILDDIDVINCVK